ncbi:MAG: nucleoside diphosphate kinase regulator [Rhodospirillaceae bacterium]
MNAVTSASRGRLPPITLTRSVADRLTGLAISLEHRHPQEADYLERELERATIVADDALPRGVVTVGSNVQFEDRDSGVMHTVTLCWPADEDVAAHRLSVLTPVGAALIGLAEGRSIAWQNRAGAWRNLRIVAVT